MSRSDLERLVAKGSPTTNPRALSLIANAEAFLAHAVSAEAPDEFRASMVARARTILGEALIEMDRADLVPRWPQSVDRRSSEPVD